MKLAEALINRADAQKRVQQLQARLARNAVVQEGEQPAEDPLELFAELDRVIAELNRLVKQINRTNSTIQFDDNRTLTDALADRDALMTERSVLNGVLTTISNQNQFRYSRSEIKTVATVDVRAIQQRIDDLSRQYREIDASIQQINWQADLIDEPSA
ncbi:MAG: DIP1984 family protein [Anaerolineae bacterium]|nr:DIP1984 family protein [Anaerolineae bacterium]MCA9890589.1 DIP1984 family protein [Anaerolineae bacterium]MCA9896213.1 DIP1984 family protein [Anaerolineae bacterium]MCB9460654.1 DIP1984 family protein [Anaerolineaceae bacterium]